MSQIIALFFGVMLSLTTFAQDQSIKGFNDRFKIVRNDQGKVVVIKLKKVVSQFSVKPFIDQIKNDLIKEQYSFTTLGASEKEADIDALLGDIGVGLYEKDAAWSYEGRKLKDALMNIPNINIEEAFTGVDNKNFWTEFQSRLQEAFQFIDPTIVANLEDPRFFYKRNVTYRVVEWALREAQKRFSSVPILNIATFVIVRVHDMMLEQRHFHHSMLLHYFEAVPETKLGLTKEEVDRSISSIFEYRIDAFNFFESNRAASDWLNYGMNSFYRIVRAGNTRIREWSGPLSPVSFQNIRKLNYGFVEVTEGGSKKIYHLHHSSHSYSSKPALAFDYADPKRVKRNRALLNLGGIAIGFIRMPSWIKGSIDDFIKSFYVQQVRTEGALVGYFEMTGNNQMIDRIYDQRANFYIVR
jgi:hypothetical protein